MSANEIRKKYIEAKLTNDYSGLANYSVTEIANAIKYDTSLQSTFFNVLKSKANTNSATKYKIHSPGLATSLSDLRNFYNFRSSLNANSARYEKMSGNKPLNDSNLVSPSRSYLMSNNDFLFSDNISNKNVKNSEVPGLILN
jgi:beta-glucosidase/6-phospho-beta-glucosidase/beta-galactosidase